MAKSKRKSSANVKVDPNVRCNRVYPVGDTSKTISSLQTVGINLTKSKLCILREFFWLRPRTGIRSI